MNSTAFDIADTTETSLKTFNFCLLLEISLKISDLQCVLFSISSKMSKRVKSLEGNVARQMSSDVTI